MFNNFRLSFDIFIYQYVFKYIFVVSTFIIFNYNVFLFVISINIIPYSCIKLSTIFCVLEIPTFFLCYFF